jgi:hypothetical protein
MRLEGRQMTAVPVCPPDNGEVILFPKPENCSEFYQCSGEIAFTHRCPVNLYYCEEKQYCSWINDPDCKFDCVFTKTNPVPAAVEYVPAADTEATAETTPESFETITPGPIETTTHGPECPEQNDTVIIFIPKHDNCSEYYECDNGKAVLLHCPPGLYFCPEKEICDWVWDSECRFNCIMKNPDAVEYVPAADAEATAETTIEPFEPTTIGPIETTTHGPDCPPQADNETVLIPKPDNCSQYYICDNGKAVLRDCPPDLYFCPQKEICDWRWDAECTFNCIMKKPAAVYDNDYTAHVTNHRNAILGTKGRRVSLYKYFH